MFMRHRRVFPNIVFAVLVFCLAAPAATGFAGDLDSLPAKQWNRENLDKIKGLPAEPLTFAVLGDTRDNPAVFGRILRRVDSDPEIAFAIHLGDLVRRPNVAEYQTFFKEVRQNLHKPLLTVIGNHELYGDRGLELFHEIFGPDYFAFQVGQNYFIVVNDNAKEGMDQEQFRWLEDELQKSQTYKTRMVFLHIPLYDPSSQGKPHSLKPAEAARLLALFKKYNVSRIFAAHIHSYYAGDWEGLSYTITGGAGAPLYGTDLSHTFYHFLKVTVRDKQVQIQVRPLPGEADQSGK